MVCAGCHTSLGGGLAVNATGEFRVPSSAELESAAVSGEQPGAMGHCAWCGKLEREVKKLLGRNHTALCNECISLCADIMEAELGSDWR